MASYGFFNAHAVFAAVELVAAFSDVAAFAAKAAGVVANFFSFSALLVQVQHGQNKDVGENTTSYCIETSITPSNSGTHAAKIQTYVAAAAAVASFDAVQAFAFSAAANTAAFTFSNKFIATAVAAAAEVAGTSDAEFAAEVAAVSFGVSLFVQFGGVHHRF